MEATVSEDEKETKNDTEEGKNTGWNSEEF